VRLKEGLGEEVSEKLVFEPELAISLISERSPGMNAVYRDMIILVHEIIKQVFSASVIEPHVTTADDVSWAITDRVEASGLVSTFKHSVGLQRQGREGTLCGDEVILPGDHLWLDMGVVGSNHGYNLWTDTQHMGYVLREGETDVPEGFKAGMRESNRLQDIQLEVMAASIGDTGNEILRQIVEKAEYEGIASSIYGHPIGDYIHGAGPSIGLWDLLNDPVPEASGSLPLRTNTWHSVELKADKRVPEWDDQVVEFRQEEDVMVLDDGTLAWAFERQTEFHIVDWANAAANGDVPPSPRMPPPGKGAAPLPPLREQAAIGKEWTDYRTEVIIPQLMEKHDVDMWIMSMKEYGEDPVWRSFTQPTETYARRRSVYIFTLEEGPQGEIKVAQNVFVGLDYQQQWPRVKEFIEAADPDRIAVNIDAGLAFSDGLAAGERLLLEEQLGEAIVARFVREPELAVDFISLRAPGMNEVYRDMNQRVHQIIRQVFSSSVIIPGRTTTDDVSWAITDRIQALGCVSTFKHSVALQRQGVNGTLCGDTVIERGDFLWLDMGLKGANFGFNLWTDTQHQGYVLREGETEVPEGLQVGLLESNRLQDIQLQIMEGSIGLSGNDILSLVAAQAESQGIVANIYGHPIGDQMHGAGPAIGLADLNNAEVPSPGKGDLPLLADTYHSVELRATVAVPEWNMQQVQFRQEEEVMILPDGRAEWAFVRQETIHVVGCKGGSIDSCRHTCDEIQGGTADFQNDCVAACDIACDRGGSNDDGDNVVIVASVCGAVGGAALIAGGFLFRKKQGDLPQGEATKEDPLLGPGV
jgi:hypothetical protein